MDGTAESPRAPSRATLEIIGAPGEAVLIYALARPEALPPIFQGEIPPRGRLRLRVPRESLHVVVAGYGEQSVRFDADEHFKSVDVRPLN